MSAQNTPKVEPHDAKFNERLNSLRAGVLGANDGIVSVSALLLGMIAAGADDRSILAAGIASTIAGAVSMSLGEYVSVSAQRDTEKELIAKEQAELSEYPVEELDELTDILSGYGISPETARRAAEEITERDALPAHLKLELGIDSEDLTSPIAAAISSAVTFLLGAALPMLAVLIFPPASTAAAVTVTTLLALGLTGFLSAKLSDTNRGRSMLRLVIGGALGLAITYGAGALFGGVA